MVKDNYYVNRKDLNDAAKLIIDQLTSRFNEKFSRLEADQNKVRSDADAMLNSVNNVQKLVEINADERLINIQQLQHIDKTLHMLADKMGIKLPQR